MQLDETERKNVYRLLENLSEREESFVVTWGPALAYKELVTILEAASRLAFWKKLLVVTDDQRVRACIR